MTLIRTDKPIHIKIHAAGTGDIDVNRTSQWLMASAGVVFVCGILTIVLPLTFSVGIAALLGWLFVVAAAAHVVFGFHFEATHWGWHASIAGLYVLAAINLLVNPLLGVLLLVLIVGVVLVAEGLIEIVLFLLLRQDRRAIWILFDGILTLVLGILACAYWPPDSLELIRYLVGLSFIASGLSRLALGLAIRAIAPAATVGA
jgi:uncharacterized membrane protein HdeD (DUF308 family)